MSSSSEEAPLHDSPARPAAFACRHRHGLYKCSGIRGQLTYQDAPLRDELDENGHQLQHAFKSDQPPLLRRDTALRAQLTHC
ncbi:MAG TPA: hypothetical protein VIM06_03240 [Rhodanobacter sp.]